MNSVVSKVVACVAEHGPISVTEIVKLIPDLSLSQVQYGIAYARRKGKVKLAEPAVRTAGSRGGKTRGKYIATTKPQTAIKPQPEKSKEKAKPLITSVFDLAKLVTTVLTDMKGK